MKMLLNTFLSTVVEIQRKIPEKCIWCVAVMTECCCYKSLMFYVLTIPSAKAIDGRT